jgi:hypothetical protein
MADDKKEVTGRAKGGVRRDAVLSSERKREIARQAARARWGLKATHKGSFSKDFGIDVDCYVLDDEAKTAVISQRGMGEALGLSKGGGSRLPRFVGSRAIAPHVGPELREKLEKPLVFQGLAAGPNMPAASTVYGYDVTILIDLCKAIIEADANGELIGRYSNVVRQAHVIIAASAKAGIKGLVYALAGYDATREEVITAFKLYVRDEAREYEKEFPDQLYEEWYRLYSMPKHTGRTKPWKFRHLTVNQVYIPLANSNGKILELTRVQRSKSETKYKKLHQFLADVGVKALRTHLGQLLGIARISDDQVQYEKHVQKIFGGQQEMEF